MESLYEDIIWTNFFVIGKALNSLRKRASTWEDLGGFWLECSVILAGVVCLKTGLLAESFRGSECPPTSHLSYVFWMGV